MDNSFSDTLDNFSDVKINLTNLESVVKNLSEVVWSVDLTSEPYQISYHNNLNSGSTLVEVFGTLPKSINEFQERIHEEDRDRVLEAFVNILSKGKGNYAYRIMKENGEYHYFRDCLSVLYQDSRPVRLDVITIDIDVIRRNRLNLELSQQRLKSIVDALPDPVFISEKHSGTVIFANEVLFDVFGMSPSDFMGQKEVQFYESFSGRKEYMSLLKTEGHVQNHELVLKNKKDEAFWVSASTMPFEFNDINCHITILQDITLRKKLESEIQESNERYQLAVEGTNDVIWEYDFERNTSYLSPQFWEGMDIAPEENPLNKDLLVKYIHEQDRQSFLAHFEDKKKKGASDLTIELRLVANEGRIIWALIKAKILYKGDNIPIRVVGSISNVTSLKLAQSRLKESEAKYKLISEHSSDCICLQTYAGDFVFVSPSSKDILGYEPMEVLSLKVDQIINESDQQRVAKEMQRVLKREEKTITLIYEALHKDGYKVWLEMTAGAIFDDNDRVLYLQTSTRDVTERILSEEKLKESEERYKLITENSHDIVSLMDLQGNYVFISPSIKDTMGYEPMDFIGRNTIDFVHPDDLEEVKQGIEYAVANKVKDGRSVFRFKHIDGSWRWIEATGGVIMDDNGEPIYLRSNKLDITEKLKTEEKLKLQEEKYKLVSENSGDIIGLHKLDGQLVFVSPSCLGLLGYSEAELQGANPMKLIKTEQRQLIYQIIKRTALNKGKDVKMTYEILHKEGHYIWVETSLTAILNQNHKADLLQSSTRDITERIEALEKERELSKLKSSFVSMASHEFRTPLTTIQSSTELIGMYMDSMDEKMGQKLGKHVGRIKTELERLNSLLKDVFTLGRLDVGKTRLNKDHTSLINILKQVVIEVKIPFPGRDVDIEVIGKECQLNLDSQLISHALSNIIGNALKYSEGAPNPMVTVEFMPECVEIRVKDEGIGIPKKDISGLFESFNRASNVGDIEGTGLGLVIVKQFIEMHHGTVTVVSEKGNGSEFTVTLPII